MTQKSITAAEFIHLLERGSSSDGSSYMSDDGNSVIVEDHVVEGEVVLKGFGLASNNIPINKVTFEHAVRFEAQVVQWFAFLNCRFEALVIENSYLPRSIGNNEICLLRLEDYSGSPETLIGYPASRIIVSHTKVSHDLASCLRPSHELVFENCELQNATIRGSSSFEGKVLGKLQVSKCSTVGHLSISTCNIEWIQISELDLQETMRFEFCAVSHLHLDNVQANGGAVDFGRVNFVKARTTTANENSYIKSRVSFQLMESRFAEIGWSFCDWTNVPMYIDDIVVRKVRLQGSSTPRQIKPVNGQWKEVVDLLGLFEANSKGQGHIADAITNKANALQAYRVYLSKQRRDSLDRITLWFSEVISNYGANWLQAILIFILSGLLLFILLLGIADDRISLFHIDSSTPKLMLDYTVWFLEFLSPFHSKSFLGFELRGWGAIIDTIARVWLGFVIYQLIRSTRKFVS